MELIKSSVLSPELLAEISELHFQTKKLADRSVSGEYKSAFRGRGMEFEDVREYAPGDDVRSIDWNVTARTHKPHIKSYREERELVVMIAIDVSASTRTGTRSQLRDHVAARVGATLALVALNNNDKVGLLTFSDKLESYHPPRKARSSVWRILHEALSPRVYGSGTSLSELCSFLSKVLKRKAIVFIVSDFFDDDYETDLAVLSKKHDVTIFNISDPADIELPDAGIVELLNPETGQSLLIDTSDPKTRENYKRSSESKRNELKNVCRKYKVGQVDISTDKPFIQTIKRFLSQKGHKTGRNF
ncbi:hypothetical protein BVY02_02360 [bacterium J17]|nr:hypothetical protein BVY02_02360 [bacterium J17]